MPILAPYYQKTPVIKKRGNDVHFTLYESPRSKSMTDEPSVSNGKSTRGKARSVRVQPAEMEPASAGGEEGILIDKEHTAKVNSVITKEIRNSTPSDQDLIDASKNDSSSRPAEDSHVGYEGESESERKAFEDAPQFFFTILTTDTKGSIIPKSDVRD